MRIIYFVVTIKIIKKTTSNVMWYILRQLKFVQIFSIGVLSILLRSFLRPMLRTKLNYFLFSELYMSASTTRPRKAQGAAAVSQLAVRPRCFIFPLAPGCSSFGHCSLTVNHVHHLFGNSIQQLPFISLPENLSALPSPANIEHLEDQDRRTFSVFLAPSFQSASKLHSVNKSAYRHNQTCKQIN